MRKVISSLFFFWMGAGLVLAQPGSREENLKSEADHYYNEEQYNLAIQYYQDLYLLSDQNAEVNYQLAESYRKTFNYPEAEVYYLKTFYQAPANFPLALYYYSLMLKLNAEYDESIIRFSEFIRLNEENKDLKEQVEQALVDRAGSEMAKTEKAKKEKVSQVKSESLNSSFNDFAPTLRDSTSIVITSGRVESNREAIDERYGEAFTDNYYFIKNGNSWQDKTHQAFAITNTRFNDGSGCFNSRGDAYYFTICGTDGPNCRIFRTNLINTKWTNPVLLNENVNFKKYECKHPAISAGGDTLLFSSNRPGGMGQFDIWMCINSGHEDWGPAVNLGSTINTKLNEIAPAFTKYSNIFFLASDGHQNYGGLDLYMVKRFSNGSLALYNLDFPFNSNRDDCFITLAGKKIYFSSNREDGKGGFDIYSVVIPSVLSFVAKMSLKNRDARGDVKINARLDRISRMELITARNEDKFEYENLTYEKKKMVDKMVSNQLHHFQNDVSSFGELTVADFETLLRISETQYKTNEIEARFTKTLLTRMNSPSAAGQEVDVTGVLKDSVSGNLLSNRQILLMDESGEVIKVTTTNEMGRFRLTNIAYNGHLYLRTLDLLVGSQERPQLHDLKISSAEKENTSKFENIYFDFNHYTLRPEAKQVLIELAIYLKQFPALQVELYAYADDLGADDYNMTLTQKRGQAVLDYMTSIGVDQTALAVTARGRQKNPTSQIDIQRQYNRRVEFHFNGPPIVVTQHVKTYILKMKSDWKSLSESTEVSAEELKKLNGATSEVLQIFQPVRIPSTAQIDGEHLFFEIR